MTLENMNTHCILLPILESRKIFPFSLIFLVLYKAFQNWKYKMLHIWGKTVTQKITTSSRVHGDCMRWVNVWHHYKYTTNGHMIHAAMLQIRHTNHAEYFSHNNTPIVLFCYSWLWEPPLQQNDKTQLLRFEAKHQEFKIVNPNVNLDTSLIEQ